MAENAAGTGKNKTDDLQEKATKSKQTFNATPPSRSDAKNIVEQRRKAQQPKARVVVPPITPVGKKDPVKRVVPKPKKKVSTPVRKPVSAKKGIKKKGGKKKNKKPSTKVQIPLFAFIIAVFLLALIIGSLLAWQIVGFKIPPLAKQRGTTSITVEFGMSARQISQILEKEGVIDSARAFEHYVENGEIATKLQPGTHTFEPNLSNEEIGEILLANGVVKGPSVMVYAGFTIAEIDTMLSNKAFIKNGEFVKATEQVVKERGLPFAEGWFLSGSYPLDADAYTLAATMQNALNDVIRPHLVKLENLDITVAQMVIIASMIQRETNTVEQMPLIAGVIYNRLLDNMPLGIDATTRYGLNAWNRALTTKDLDSDNPYNTRRIAGLPPTGIGSPSPAALEAALNPAVHNYFYYLHDPSGEIHLATTYEGHKENIAKYLGR